MEKISGTIVPMSTKAIASVETKVVVVSKETMKVSDIQFQEGLCETQHNINVAKHFTVEDNQMHFNFLARGTTTVIIPYMSEVPYETSGTTFPCETDYITAPIKTDLLIHAPFSCSTESFRMGSGLTSQAKHFELNASVDGYTRCIYDGGHSKQYIDDIEVQNVFVGRELRLPNADAKYTIEQNDSRKTTGVLSANKTRREI